MYANFIYIYIYAFFHLYIYQKYYSNVLCEFVSVELIKLVSFKRRKRGQKKNFIFLLNIISRDLIHLDCCFPVRIMTVKNLKFHEISMRTAVKFTFIIFLKPQ